MTAVLTVPPEDAQQGDACGLITDIGAPGGEVICPGTLECYVDVHGRPPEGCRCHVSPPCHLCVEAPLVCTVCRQTVP